MLDDYVVFSNVVRTYHSGEVDIKAIDGLSFSLQQAKFSVIVGPSGAGKTTILNIFGGMDTVSSGKVVVDGKEITNLSNKQLTAYRRNDIGFVFQFYNLIPNLTALENVELSLHIKQDNLDPRQVLRQVGLQDRLDHFPAQLSGGEQQRVAIARALAKKPKLLLCDEPTGALDYQTGKGILQLLQNTCQQHNISIVLITHNSAIVPIADRVVKIKSGKVEAILDNPQPQDVSSVEW